MLTKDEIRRLFQTAGEATKIDRRNKVLFHLLYTWGLRIGEGVWLRIEDVNLEGGTLRLIGKDEKERQLFLKPAMVTLLRKHIKQDDIIDFPFPSRESSRVAIGTGDCRLFLTGSRRGAGGGCHIITFLADGRLVRGVWARKGKCGKRGE